MLLCALSMALTVSIPVTQAEYADLATRAAQAAVAKFSDKSLKLEQLGVTIGRIDRATRTYISGSVNGDAEMYPASVVKLFFLAYAGHLMDEGKLKSTPEYERAAQDMIVDSSNDAMAMIVDTVTGTTGGPELGASELKAWMKKRQIVNEWFASLGYKNVNASQKTWNEGPYGRERQGYGPHFELRNSLTPNNCARLMSEIALDKIASHERCAWMKGFLKRDIVADVGEKDANFQSKAFTGKIAPKGTVLYTKAGWTDTVRHDVSYLIAPDGREFVLAIFTKGQSDNADLIPFISSELLKGLGVLPKESR